MYYNVKIITKQKGDTPTERKYLSTTSYVCDKYHHEKLNDGDHKLILHKDKSLIANFVYDPIENDIFIENENGRTIDRL